MPLEEKKEQNNRERNEKKRFEAHRRMVTEKLFSRVDFTEGKVMKKKKVEVCMLLRQRERLLS